MDILHVSAYSAFPAFLQPESFYRCMKIRSPIITNELCNLQSNNGNSFTLVPNLSRKGYGISDVASSNLPENCKIAIVRNA